MLMYIGVLSVELRKRVTLELFTTQKHAATKARDVKVVNHMT